MRICKLIIFSGLSCLGLAVTVAHASDGVFEINADCATVGGCFEGDSSGYPVTITNAGSYRLTGNLATGNVNQTLIEVNASEVSIDLNGFSLIGPVTCSGNPNVCSSSGTGRGITIFSSSNSVSVFNGTVRGMGETGILLGKNAIVENVKLIENGFSGLVLSGSGSTGVAKNIIAQRNGNHGISSSGANLFVMDSTLTLNTARGQWFGRCSNIFSANNGQDTICFGIAPNSCEDPAACN